MGVGGKPTHLPRTSHSRLQSIFLDLSSLGLFLPGDTEHCCVIPWFLSLPIHLEVLPSAVTTLRCLYSHHSVFPHYDHEWFNIKSIVGSLSVFFLHLGGGGCGAGWSKSPALAFMAPTSSRWLFPLFNYVVFDCELLSIVVYFPPDFSRFPSILPRDFSSPASRTFSRPFSPRLSHPLSSAIYSGTSI